MTNDPLATTIQQIRRVCKKQKISLFPGVMALADQSSHLTIDFAGNDWQNYLSFVTTLPDPTIILHAEINFLTREEIFSVRSPYRERARFKRYCEGLKTLSNETGHIASFALNSFQQGVNYRFSQAAGWLPLYRQLNAGVSAMRAKEKRPIFDSLHS